MDASHVSCPPFDQEQASLIVSTRIRVGRNLADYPLGPQLSREQRKEVEQKVAEAVGMFEGDLKGQYYALESLTEE
jgi:arginine kinase